MKKVVTSWVICVLALVGLFAWLGATMPPQPHDSELGSDTTLIKADFSLQNAQGKTISASDLRGRYLLVYFGFTHCPDICPTTLLLMQNAIAQLGANAKKVQPVFITVDPERDTPKAVGDYVAHFGTNVLGLTGSAEQIKHAADSFKVYYSKVEQKDSALGYVVDHSGFIYLMGPDGRYITHFTHETAEPELTKELMAYVR